MDSPQLIKIITRKYKFRVIRETEIKDLKFRATSINIVVERLNVKFD